jgi:DNA-binding ferritin-like protein (Dps family)
MKKSEFKDKIKEMILKEMEDEKVVDVNDETPESEEDFLAELEGMLNEANEFDTNKPARIAAFIKDLDALMDEYHAELYLFGGILDAIEMVKKVAQEEIDMLNEAEGDEEVTDDVTTDDVAVDDTETIDTTTTTEVNPDVKAVQDSLTQAQAAAQKLGDAKLTDQIGNTITFFTRAHVVEKGAVAEGEGMKEVMIPIEPGDNDYDIGYKTFFVYEDRIGGFGIEDIKKAGKIIANKIKSDNKIQNTDDFFRGFMDSWRESDYDETADKEDMYESKKTVNESMFPLLKKILK